MNPPYWEAFEKWKTSRQACYFCIFLPFSVQIFWILFLIRRVRPYANINHFRKFTVTTRIASSCPGSVRNQWSCCRRRIPAASRRRFVHIQPPGGSELVGKTTFDQNSKLAKSQLQQVFATCISPAWRKKGRLGLGHRKSPWGEDPNIPPSWSMAQKRPTLSSTGVPWLKTCW